MKEEVLLIMRDRFYRLTGSRFLLVVAFLAVFMGYWLRVINLDQDLPPWGVANYQPKDEGCYAMLAVNEWEYGTIAPEVPLAAGESRPMYIQEHVRINYLGNLLEIAGFHTLGDNYYGLRMPMVLLGFFNLILAAAVLILLRREYGQGTRQELWGICFLLLLLSLHFYYFISSRTVEPSTLRMAFVQLSILIWLVLKKHHCICFFLQGIVITVSVFLVYITNVFLYLAAALLLLMVWKTDGRRMFFSCTVWFCAGSILMLALAEIYYFRAWGCGAIQNLFGAVGLFKSTDGYTMANSLGGALRGAVKGTAKYFSSFFFLYAPALLLLTAALLPAWVYFLIKDRDKTLFFLLAIPASFLVQTMVSEDYIWRKMIVVAPVFLYLVFWGVLRRADIADAVGIWQRYCDRIEGRVKKGACQALLPLYLLLSVAFTITMVVFHIAISNDLGKLDFTALDKLVILVFGCLPVFLWGVLRSYGALKRKGASIGQTACLLGCSTLLLNLCMLGIHVWSHPTFGERDMMKSLSEEYHLDGQYILGDYAIGITLYNDIKPVLEHYTNYQYRMVETPGLMMHHYAIDSQGMREYMDYTIFSSLSEYAPKEVYIVPGTFQTYGQARDFALYIAAPRAEIVMDNIKNMEETVQSVQEQIAELEKDNQKFGTKELLEEKKKILDRLSNCEQYYDNYYGDRVGTILSPIYVDTYGDIYGDICAPIYGRVFGTIYGDIKAPIYGEIFGDVYGNLYEDVEGRIHGELVGDVRFH